MTSEGRPMDGTGTLLRRDPDGHPTEDHFGGATVHGGYWVQLVDAWPHGRLQAQLDRIEARLGGDRWAAFTDDELDGMLDTWSHYTNDRDGHLQFEVEAELERRKP